MSFWWVKRNQTRMLNEPKNHSRLNLLVFALMLLGLAVFSAGSAETQDSNGPTRDAMWAYKTDAIIASPAAVVELIAFCQQHHVADLFFATHYISDQKGHYVI